MSFNRRNLQSGNTYFRYWRERKRRCSGAQKNELVQVAPTHIEVFVEHNNKHRRWVLHFSENDPGLSEDLLYDFFLHFTTNRPNLTSIDNMEGYLYVIMPNLHLLQVRRAMRTPFGKLSVVEYDTVDVGFWASDPRERIGCKMSLARYASTPASAKKAQRLARCCS